MNIAILGATSQIAKDLIYSLIAEDRSRYSLTLFARSPEKIIHQLNSVGITAGYSAYHFDEFNKRQNYDLIINFVGVGNPAQAAAMGASIFDVTLKYDDLALGYLQSQPDCRYIFLSSGAAYGVNFEKPVDERSLAVIPLNNFQSQDWYSIAKLHAECRHRSLGDNSIVDIRIFNYFSSTQDMSARFLITDIVRAIYEKTVLITSEDNICRDFLCPSDFYALVKSMIFCPRTNMAVDAYSKAPVKKINLLSALYERYGLQYEFTKSYEGVNATGTKSFYYSSNKAAAKFGYTPQFTSIEGVIDQIDAYLYKIGSNTERF